MSVFRYYLPGIAKDVTDEALAKAGLSAQFADVPAGERGVVDVLAGGPDGSSGVMVLAMPRSGEPVPRMGWSRDQQDAVNYGGYWLVTDREHPPTPSGLERVTQVSGYCHKLGDGRVWECPVIMQPTNGAVNLPQVYRHVDGEWQAEVSPAYQDVWRKSMFWSIRFLPDYAEITWPQLFGLTVACNAAAQALAVNYRVTPVELSALSVLTTQAVGDVLDSAVDRPYFDDLDLKKKASIIELLEGLRSTEPGSPESTPDTDQAEPTTNSSDADTDASLSTSPSP